MQVQRFADVFDALADTPAEAGDLKARSDLLSALTDRVKAWELPRWEAAKRLGIEPDRLDDLRQGKLSRFSRDDLVSLTVAAEATLGMTNTLDHGRVPSQATPLKAACGAATRLLCKP
jgi:predicted XRE-type DNA-binding protein